LTGKDGVCYVSRIPNRCSAVRYQGEQQNSARKKLYDYIYFAGFRKLYEVSGNGALNTTKVRVGTQKKLFEVEEKL